MNRVLHVVSSLNVGSGIMNVIMNYFKEVNQSYTFDFMYFSDFSENFSSEIKELGGELYKIDKPTIKDLLLKNKEMGKLLEKYHIVHVHEILLLRMIGINKSKNTKIIAHSHSTAHSHKVLSNYRNRLLKLLSKKYIDYRAACSYSAGVHYFGKSFLHRSEDKVIVNAVNYTKYLFVESNRIEYRKKFSFSDEFIVGQIGRFDKNKNQKFSIKLLKSILDSGYKNIRFIFIGDGDFDKKTTQYILSNNLSDYIMHQEKTSNTAKFYSAIDCLIMPSFFEGIPLTPVEGQVSGLLCVLSSKIDVEVKFTDDVIFLDNQDINLWKEAILARIKNNSNRGIRIRYDNYDVREKAIELCNYYGEISS